jgi:hypothetical protein
MGRSKLRAKPVFTRLETQARLTLALLPLGAALPILSDEMIARLFGQSMAILNWVPGPLPDLTQSASPTVIAEPRPKPRSQEEQRAYWREAQRAYRKRKKTVNI